MEYLGFWIKCNELLHINKKIEAITNMNPHTSQKEVWYFIGVVNYYRDIWPSISRKLLPLTGILSNK